MASTHSLVRFSIGVGEEDLTQGLAMSQPMKSLLGLPDSWGIPVLLPIRDQLIVKSTIALEEITHELSPINTSVGSHVV